MDAEVKSLPSEADLVARAREIAPVLAGCAAATEANRSMLPETLELLRDAGLFRIMQAPRYGGYGMGLPAMAEVTAEIARGSASDAWVLGLCGNQNRFVGCYPPEAQEEVYAKSGDHLITCLVTGPTTTAQRVDGGFTLCGKWPYVSGVDQCNWLLLSAFDGGADAAGASASLTFLVPRDAVADVIDDWHVMGLRGTGSKTVVLKEVFVPAYRALNVWNYDNDPPPGAAVNAGAMYRGVPRIMIFSTMVAAPALGIAAAAVDAYRDRLETRNSALMSGKQSETAPSQIALGRASEQAAMARDILLGAANDFQRRAEAGDAFSAEDRIGHRLRMAEVLRLCTQVVTDVFMDAGTGAMFDRNPLQRMFRDIYAIRSHVAIDPNNAAENRGRLALGIDPKPPFV